MGRRQDFRVGFLSDGGDQEPSGFGSEHANQYAIRIVAGDEDNWQVHEYSVTN